jgi:hypothetical protein
LVRADVAERITVREVMGMLLEEAKTVELGK